MATVREVYQYLDSLAPFSLQMSFDNSGLLVGRSEHPVTKILLALDITEEVVAEAAARGAELIVSHHPVLFHPAKNLTDGSPTGRRLLALIENGIAAVCAHTNLDVAAGGVNDVLAHKLGLTGIEMIHPEGLTPDGTPYGLGRMGYVAEEQAPAQFAVFVKAALGSAGVRCADAGRPVRKVAVVGGAGVDMAEHALAQGCDTLVTSDVRYHEFLDVRDQGLNLMDAGHFPTENLVCSVLADWLRKGFPETEVWISERHREIFSCL